MSETTKNAETMKKAADHTARSSQSTFEAAGKTTKDNINETSKVAEHATDRMKDAGQSMTETATEAAHAAANMSTKVVEQGREAMLMGVRTAAGVSGQVADISFGRGHHMMSSAAHAMDIYRDASERSADRVHALFTSAMTFGRGLQSMQHAWLEMVDSTMEHAAHKPQDLLRCKNVVELAEVQRDLYLDAVNHAFESTSRMLEMAGRTVQDAVRPLRS